MSDRPIVECQLDRPLRAEVEVVSRCHLGLPVVVAVPPLLDDGTPFPTRFWLSCPLARRRVSRLESAGGVARLEAFIAEDPERRARQEHAESRYAEERDRLVAAGTHPAPSGGVGGNAGAGLKCLHAHYADHGAGNVNPVGSFVAPFVEPLNCTMPCVGVEEGSVERNPGWEEPR